MKRLSKLVFVSISNVAGGAEQILLMSAVATKAPMLFLKKEKEGCLSIPESVQTTYLSEKSTLLGLIVLLHCLFPYRKDYTIISTHPYVNAYLGLLKRVGFLKSKLVVRECTAIFTRYKGLKRIGYQLVYQLGYKGADRVICQTEVMRNDFLKYNPYLSSKKVIVQVNPIDRRGVLQAAEINIEDITHFGNYLCAAGRLIPEKGFDTMIQAFQLIQRSHPELKLVILGEGPQRQELMHLVNHLNLNDSVVFKGWVANPMPYFKHAAVCVMSSVKEGFPNVLLQMMLLNPAVVSTLCAGGIAEIPGLKTVPVDNPKVLATAITSLLNQKTIQHQSSTNAYLEHRSPATFIASIVDAL